jgi:hypothetical protein
MLPWQCRPRDGTQRAYVDMFVARVLLRVAAAADAPRFLHLWIVALWAWHTACAHRERGVDALVLLVVAAEVAATFASATGYARIDDALYIGGAAVALYRRQTATAETTTPA